MHKNNLPMGASAALPLADAAKALGHTENELLRNAVLDGVPIYVPYKDEIVEWSGKATGRSFSVYCRLTDYLLRQLMVSEEVSIPSDLLLAWTPSPDTRFKNLGDALLCFVQDPEGGGHFDLTTGTKELRVKRHDVRVMDCHMDWFKSNATNASVTETQQATSLVAGEGTPCPEKFTLYWLRQKMLNDEDRSFYQKALVKLEQLEEQQPKKFRSTHTTASSGTALVNHWLVNRDLVAYERGKPIEDFAALRFEPKECSIGDAMELLQASIDIKRDELVDLITREGLTVPKFLRVPTLPHQRAVTQSRPALKIKGGSGYFPSIEYKFEKPDWDRWRRIDRTLLWKAACLVADIEPPEKKAREIWYEEQLKTFPASFHGVWEAVNGDERLSRLEVINISGRMEHNTSIGWFANWALEKGFPLHDELRERARQFTQSTRDGTPAHVTDAGTQERRSETEKQHAAASAKRPDGTWDREALSVEHDALTRAGSVSPTKYLAKKYAVSETVIRRQKQAAATGKASSTKTPASWISPLQKGK
jgi:hypothetical protein